MLIHKLLWLNLLLYNSFADTSCRHRSLFLLLDLFVDTCSCCVNCIHIRTAGPVRLAHSVVTWLSFRWGRSLRAWVADLFLATSCPLIDLNVVDRGMDLANIALIVAYYTSRLLPCAAKAYAFPSASRRWHHLLLLLFKCFHIGCDLILEFLLTLNNVFELINLLFKFRHFQGIFFSLFLRSFFFYGILRYKSSFFFKFEAWGRLGQSFAWSRGAVARGFGGLWCGFIVLASWIICGRLLVRMSTDLI